ncbi:DUF1542 domain-containing protein, partial [Lactobacillaceae bacterium 24-114]
MVSKNNKKLIAEKNRKNEKQRFGIRKLNVGVASVLLGLTFSIYGGSQVVAQADTIDNGQTDETSSNQVLLGDQQEVTLTQGVNNTSSSTMDTSQNAATESTTASETNEENAESATQSLGDEKQIAASASTETSEEVTQETSNSSNIDNSDQGTISSSESVDVSQVADESNATTLNSDTPQNDADSEETITQRALRLYANSLAATTTSEDDENTVTVTTAQEFIDAIQKGTATTINIANDIDLGTVKSATNTNVVIANKRNIVIQSADGEKKTVDFNGYSFQMNSNDYGVTFKNLNLYGRSYFGMVRNAGSYTFDNIDYTGSQLVYTEASYSTNVIFNGNVNVASVASYTSPLNGTSYTTQGSNGNQQVLQFRGGTNSITFNESSNVKLVTYNANVIENGGTATINVKNNANVILEPHTKTGMEQFFSVDGIARGIASNGTTTLNIDTGSNLTITLSMDSGDRYLSSAMYLNSGATINNNGKLNIVSNGAPYYRAAGTDDPIYINGNVQFNVGSGATLDLTATNLGSFNGHLMTISGNATVNLDPHSNFKISGDGDGALTAIYLSSGSKFISDQPDLFEIDLSQNTSTSKALIKNGTINFTRVKTVSTDGNTSEALGKIDVTYDANGNVTSYVITSQDESTVKEVATALTDKTIINLIQAGEDVTLSNLHLDKNNQLTGTVASSGSDNPIYVTVSINGVSTSIPVAGSYILYTNTNGTVTEENINYAAETGSTGGTFSVDLSTLASSLTDDTQISVVATKDFVNSNTITETVAALRALDTTALQELVDAAPSEKSQASYYNASADAQKAYDEAISAGQTILDNSTNYDQSDIDEAVTAIQNAKSNLTGQATDKTALQTAVDESTTVKASADYTGADAADQEAYDNAITAAEVVLSNSSATQAQVDEALANINAAKGKLNGLENLKQSALDAINKAADTKNSEIDASTTLTTEEKEALKKQVTEEVTNATTAINASTTADQIKTAQDNGVSAIEGITVPSTSTAKDEAIKAIDDALTKKL